MNQLTPVKKISLGAMCIALCYVLPIAFHAIGLGSVLSPMHIPVLLCGIVCGGGWGAICGILGPCLSSLLSSMPPLMMLPRMIPELLVYGLVAGLCMKRVRTGNTAADTYISLGTAMIAGRVAGGIATAIFNMVTSGVYSLELWITSYVVESVPGIIAHLILVPLLVLTLEKAKVIPARYSK